MLEVVYFETALFTVRIHDKLTAQTNWVPRVHQTDFGLGISACVTSCADLFLCLVA